MSPLWLAYPALLVITLHGAASFSISNTISTFSFAKRCMRSRHDLAYYATTNVVEDSPVSNRWYHVPKNSLLRDEEEDAASTMRGCDAVVMVANDVTSPDDKIWARTIHNQIESTNKIIAMASQEDDYSMTVPKEAIDAIEATHRWSSNFVRRLNLCPWAGSSLDTEGAIRYWVLVVDDDDDDDDDGNAEHIDEQWAVVLDEMECIVREAGKQLEQITSSSASEEEENCERMDRIDPSVAISFVILASKSSTPELLPDFDTFHDFFTLLEDRLLDACDEYWDFTDDDDGEEVDHESDSPLGCKITPAAFHPQWQFGQDADSEGGEMESPIDFEKRTPYPTISIVMSTAIDALMNERESDDIIDNLPEADDSAPATKRIAALNEATLESIGADRLREIFDAEVMQSSTIDE